MPRHRRRTVSGAIVHAISRVVDGEFRIDDEARANYLARLGPIARRTSWKLLAFALMSNHIHWVLQCFGDPIRRLLHPLHTGFANWLNERDGRLTPVFAARPATYLYEVQAAPKVIAYVHNNPVRAAVVDRAELSSWTSHRAYLGLDFTPPWLDVESGLHLCTGGDDGDSRRRFAELVEREATEPRNSLYEVGRLARARRAVRKALNAPLEVASPGVSARGLELPLLAVADMPVVECWEGELAMVFAEVERETGVTVEEIRSPRREHRLVLARTLALFTACECLGRTVTEVAAAFGRTGSAGSRLLGRHPERRRALMPVARRIAERLRQRA